MKAVGYLRVSTVGQAAEDRFGLAEQKKIIEDYAEENGYEMAEWFTDGGFSGVKEDRPAMNELLYGAVQNPPIEAAIVAKSDRVARDMKLYYYYLMLLEKKGIKLISATEPVVNDDTGLGDIYRSLMLFVAAEERKNIAYRTSKGKEQKALLGGYIGGRPTYGYMAVNKELLVNEKEAKIVRTIFSMRRAGYSIPKIQATLIEENKRTRAGTFFSVGQIGHILDYEPFYGGYYIRGGNWIKGRHTPIVKISLEELVKGGQDVSSIEKS